jgi:type I restriction enzyme S subunit
MLSDKTLRLSVGDGCSPRYLNLANRAEAARAHYENEASGTSSSMKNVSQRAIRRTPIPLPPREEQDRIVAIVDELMGFLRRLRVEMAT